MANFIPLKKHYELLSLFALQTLAAPAMAQLPQLDWAKTIGDPRGSVQIESAKTTRFGDMVVCGRYSGVLDLDPSPATWEIRDTAGGRFIASYDPQGNFRFGFPIKANIAAWDVNGFSGEIAYVATFNGSVDFDPGPAAHILSTSSNSYAIGWFSPDGEFEGAIDTKLSPGNVSVADLSVNSRGLAFLAGSFSGQVQFDPGLDTAVLHAEGPSDGFLMGYYYRDGATVPVIVGGPQSERIETILSHGSGVIIGGSFGSSANFSGTAPVTTLVGKSQANGFVSNYSFLDYTGFHFFDAYQLGQDIREINMDYQAGSLSIYGIIGDSASFDLNGRESTLYGVNEEDGFVLRTGTQPFVKAIRRSLGGLPGPLAMSVSPGNGLGSFFSGSTGTQLDVNGGLSNGILVPSGRKDGFIGKFDATGNLSYGFVLGSGAGTLTHACVDVRETGGIMTCGYTDGTIDLDPGPGVSQVASPGINTFISFIARYKDANTLAVPVTANNAAVKILNAPGFAVVDMSGAKTVDASLLVTDITGRKVLQERIVNNSMMRFETSGWIPGIYVVTVINEGEHYASKISVQ